MNTRIIQQNGYTLIELLLYVSIVGSLLIAISLFFATAIDARIKGQSIVEVDQQGAAAMEYMTQTVRNATSVTAPAAGASGATLSLGVPTGGLSPTTFTSGGPTSALLVQEGAGGLVALTNDNVQVMSLTFTNLATSGTPGVIQISLTIKRVNPSGKNAYDYQKTFTASAAPRIP